MENKFYLFSSKLSPEIGGVKSGPHLQSLSQARVLAELGQRQVGKDIDRNTVMVALWTWMSVLNLVSSARCFSVPKLLIHTQKCPHETSQAYSALQAGGQGQRVYACSRTWSRAAFETSMSRHLAVPGMGVVLHRPEAQEMVLFLGVLRESCKIVMKSQCYCIRWEEMSNGKEPVPEKHKAIFRKTFQKGLSLIDNFPGKTQTSTPKTTLTQRVWF